MPGRVYILLVLLALVVLAVGGWLVDGVRWAAARPRPHHGRVATA